MIRKYPDSSVVAYTTKGKLPAFSPSTTQQVYLYNARAYNNTGAAANVGILALLVTGEYRIWQYTAVGPVYTEVTSAITAGTATNLFTTTNNDGFVFQARKKFGLLGFTVSSASGAGVYTYQYYNGSAFTTLPVLEVPVYSGTGDIWIVFQPPSDWVKGGAASLDSSMFSILVQATTHPTTAVAVTNAWSGHFLELYLNVPNNAAAQVFFPSDKPYVLSGNSGLIPYFSATNAQNQFGAYFSITG